MSMTLRAERQAMLVGLHSPDARCTLCSREPMNAGPLRLKFPARLGAKVECSTTLTTYHTAHNAWPRRFL